MKRCPVCNRTYSDESLSFCLADGGLLSASEGPEARATADAQETLALPAREVAAGAPTAPAAPRQVALELRRISKRFGEVLANDRVNIKVRAGTIHAIVGENGAGKSTAMRIAYGFYKADDGEVMIDGKARRIETPHDAIALGVGMVHQHFMLVEPMTVAENIVLGAETGGVASLDLRKAAQEIRALTEEFKLS